MELMLSKLSHTWIFDLDGTLVTHNGYKEGEDELLPGVKALFESIPAEDFVLILTAREAESRVDTEDFLKRSGLRYNEIIFEVPMGERVLVNDDKPSGLCCAYSLRRSRNQGFEDLQFKIDASL